MNSLIKRFALEMEGGAWVGRNCVVPCHCCMGFGEAKRWEIFESHEMERANYIYQIYVTIITGFVISYT